MWGVWYCSLSTKFNVGNIPKLGLWINNGWSKTKKWRGFESNPSHGRYIYVIYVCVYIYLLSNWDFSPAKVMLFHHHFGPDFDKSTTRRFHQQTNGCVFVFHVSSEFNQQAQGFHMNYHLVIWHSYGKSIVNGGFNGKSSVNGQFFHSYVMLNNQRVSAQNIP